MRVLRHPIFDHLLASLSGSPDTDFVDFNVYVKAGSWGKREGKERSFGTSLVQYCHADGAHLESGQDLSHAEF